MADFPEEASTRWFHRIGQPEAIGALRFMPDGSFLLRPGPQPDVLSLDCIANQVVLSVSISRMSGGRYLMQQHKRGDDLVAPLEYGSLAEMLARNRSWLLYPCFRDAGPHLLGEGRERGPSLGAESGAAAASLAAVAGNIYLPSIARRLDSSVAIPEDGSLPATDL